MYQPLKRFTQCSSLMMLFGVFIVLFGVSSTALSTFGKSNSQNQATQAPPIKAKACTSQADCVSIQGTTCVRDYPTTQTRCLCGDNTTPINGRCKAKYQALRHICIDSKQCDEGMICSTDNATKTTSMSRNTNNYKICLCDTEIGYEETLNFCSGCTQLLTGILVPLMSLLIGTLLAKRPNIR